MIDEADWQAATAEEIDWWEHWLRTRGSDWPDDFARRIDPQQPLPAILEEALKTADFRTGSRIKILDVGAGPVTNVGTRSDDFVVEVTPIDPLADAYNALIDRYNIEVPVRSLRGEAENLNRQFAPGSFDVVWMCNSLDHGMDPALGLFQAFQVLKIPGLLVLSFHRNEADHGDYQGLHNWNFDMRGGEFVIESHGKLVNVSRILGAQAKLKVLLKQKPKTFKSKVVLAFQKERELSLFEMLAASRA